MSDPLGGREAKTTRKTRTRGRPLGLVGHSFTPTAACWKAVGGAFVVGTNGQQREIECGVGTVAMVWDGHGRGIPKK